MKFVYPDSSCFNKSVVTRHHQVSRIHVIHQTSISENLEEEEDNNVNDDNNFDNKDSSATAKSVEGNSGRGRSSKTTSGAANTVHFAFEESPSDAQKACDRSLKWKYDFKINYMVVL